MNPGALLLAQARETLDAADRLGHSNVATVLAFAALVLAGAVAVLVREVVRLHAARLADADARLANAEKHAAEMLALQGQMIPRIAEVTEAATALSGVAAALTDARDTYERATPLSTPAPPPPRGSRGGRT